MSLDDSTPSLTRSTAISLPDGRPSYAVGYATYTLVVIGSDTAGAYAFLDGFVPPDSGPPPHCHGHEEMFFVIEGELDFFYDGVHAKLGPYAGISFPSWTPHTYRNSSKTPARVLITVSPAGFEGYLREIGQQVATRTCSLSIYPEIDQEKVDRLKLESSRRHNARLLPDDMFDHLLDEPNP